MDSIQSNINQIASETNSSVKKSFRFSLFNLLTRKTITNVSDNCPKVATKCSKEESVLLSSVDKNERNVDKSEDIKNVVCCNPIQIVFKSNQNMGMGSSFAKEIQGEQDAITMVNVLKEELISDDELESVMPNMISNSKPIVDVALR